jgi:hypothetical protein
MGHMGHVGPRSMGSVVRPITIYQIVEPSPFGFFGNHL